MKSKKRQTPNEEDEKYTDISILEALYEIGERVARNITSISTDEYPLDEKEDGYTASEICKRMGRGWRMPEGADSHEFCISVGTFHCRASYANIFYLISRFEKICRIGGKKRKKFVLEAK